MERFRYWGYLVPVFGGKVPPIFFCCDRWDKAKRMSGLRMAASGQAIARWDFELRVTWVTAERGVG